MRKSMDAMLEKIRQHPLSRRRFLQVSGAAAGAAGAAGVLLKGKRAEAANDTGIPDALESAADVDVRYTVCLGCHSKCGISVRVQDDTILKIDGNPWHPNCAETGQRLDFSATLEEARQVSSDGDGQRWVTACPKGQAGVEVMYNPFRIRQPLRRKGARGSGRWESVSWSQVLNDIADELRPFYEGADPAAPAFLQTADGSNALGTVANQVVFSPGRIQHGQKEFTDRVWKGGFGTVNSRHDHTSICETSHHVAGAFLTERFLPSRKDVKHHFKPDMLNAEYVIWFGTNPLEANFPAQTLARKMVVSRADGVRHVIVDPRHSRACAFGHRWLPVRPGGDGALAMGLGRVIVERGIYDATFLEAANNQAALALTDWRGHAKDLQYNATDGTHLVVVKASDEGHAWLFYRSAEGAFSVVNPASGATEVLDTAAAAAAQWGKLALDGTEAGTVDAASLGLRGVGEFVIDVNGDGSVYCAPVFQLYDARLMAHGLDYYARASGIDADTIEAVALEFAAAGRRAVATAYRGACQHTNGTNVMQAILVLNHLVGCWDWKGGSCGGTGGHLHEMGGKADGQMSIGSQAVAKRSPSGPQITRVKSFYDSSMAAALGEQFGEDTKRPWFPYAYNGNYQEVVPSMGDGYPYPVGVFISYWNNVPYSAPAARDVSHSVLTDTSLVPVHVNFDVEMSEMAALADYVLPDGTYFERWSVPHNAPTLMSKYSSFRSPVVGYYANKIGPNGKTYWQSLRDHDLRNWNYEIDWENDEGPFTIEDILMSLMQRVSNPGGGDLSAFAGFGDAAYHESHAAMVAAGASPSLRNELNTAWDWYWNILVNWVIEAGVDPNDAAAIDDMIHKIVERGGWFQDTALDGTNEYDGDYVKNRMKASSKGKSLHFFFEYAYPADHPDRPGERYRDPFSQGFYDPLPAVSPVRDSKGRPVDDGMDFPLKSVTYKHMYHAQGRTDSLDSLTVLEPENGVEMNTADARRFGLEEGDLVKVSSASNQTGVRGRVHVTERIRPGVIAVSHSRGRWENNSKQYTVNGASTGTSSRRGKGLTTNPVLRLDPVLGDVTLQDPIGGSASFSDTAVKVEKVLI